MPPANGSSTRGGSTSVRGRVRSPYMAKLQAASVPIQYNTIQYKICKAPCCRGFRGAGEQPRAAARLGLGQTDGRISYRLMPLTGGGIISRERLPHPSQKCPFPWGISAPKQYMVLPCKYRKRHLDQLCSFIDHRHRPRYACNNRPHPAV